MEKPTHISHPSFNSSCFQNFRGGKERIMHQSSNINSSYACVFSFIHPMISHHWHSNHWWLCYTTLVSQLSESLDILLLSSSLKSSVFSDERKRVGWLIVWGLWHINLCRLFNAKFIFMQIVLFQTIQFRISTLFKCKYGLIVKNISITNYSI